jgi:hypothetical protein
MPPVTLLIDDFQAVIDEREQLHHELLTYFERLRVPKLMLYYEDLVAEPEVYVGRLLSFLGVPFIPLSGDYLKITHDAHDLARYNIRVNAVSPGVVPTNLQIAAGLFDSTDAYKDWLLSATPPMGRVGEPGEVAQAILFLLGDSAGWIIGTTLNVDGGLSLS